MGHIICRQKPARGVPDSVHSDTNLELLEWLARISPRHEAEWRSLQSQKDAAAAKARAELEQLEWLAKFSPRHEEQLRRLLREQEEANRSNAGQGPTDDSSLLHEEEWDPAKHPRAGGPPNPGWFAAKGGSGAGGRKPSLMDKVVQRNLTVAELSGVNTPAMIRSSRLALELQAAATLPFEVTKGAVAGLGTGGKAVVNGSATAVLNVITLGLSSGQLELIGVTDEDRARGYDSAVAIATASGEVLVAVGTGGIASALSKGGTVARTASGALVAFDAAGNAVGVVQGVYDASQNGVNIGNGAQIAGGLLGLGANANAAQGLSAAAKKRLAEIDAYVAKLPRKTTPTSRPSSLYEIKHTGPYNYTVSGGGVEFAIDGYRGTTILEAKHVGDSTSSPFVPGSSCFGPVRQSVLGDVREELRKVKLIIESGSTPFTAVEIITNTAESKKLFESMLRDCRVPGTVQLGR